MIQSWESMNADTSLQPVTGFQVAPAAPSSPRVHSIFVGVLIETSRKDHAQ
ncbi:MULTISPECIES: hypothetical protein [unclassified Streptomyces]|uniref:hypothetical protein n=1 Tax=unclassified Streptomyces TaxID=2593676 RepID=UPI003444AABA